MATLLKDLQYGFRTLRKSKGFTAVAVLTTAVGIAANTTVFSWINGVLLRPFPGAGDPGRLVALETVAPSGEHITTSYPDFRDLRDRAQLLDGVLATNAAGVQRGRWPSRQPRVGRNGLRPFLRCAAGQAGARPFFVGQERTTLLAGT